MLNLNALDVLNNRRLHFAPVQFAKLKIGEVEFYADDMVSWIKSHLKGRYYLESFPGITEDGRIKSSIFVGFEDHKELTYFMLACPFLRRKL
jgi:hypothetical protein